MEVDLSGCCFCIFLQDDDFERTGGFLGNTMNRVLRLAKGSHNYYILYIFLFSIVVFFILWLTIKFR